MNNNWVINIKKKFCLIREMISLSDIIKFIYNPESFPFGDDVEKTEIIKTNNSQILFKKKFKKNKLEKYIKTLYFIKQLELNDFIPKLIDKNNKELEITVTYCGKLGKIRKLPKDWKEQLRSIKKELMKKNIIFLDWGSWDINPFILNNICIQNEKIYFIDFGDCEYKSSNEIDEYFERNIKHMEFIINRPVIYLFYHYLSCILNMIYRKLTRWTNIVIILLIIKIYFF